MATNKVKLSGVRVSPDILANLKRLHEKEARVRYRSKRRLTFSSWIEELLSDDIREIDNIRKEESSPTAEWEGFND